MANIVARNILEVLRERDVKYVFGLPGSTEGSVLDEFGKLNSGPELVLCLHEGAAVAMADGYARISNEVGVCLVHTTVGSGNAISQLFNSYQDCTAVLCLVGHKDTALYNVGGFCTTPHLPNWFDGCAKSAIQLYRAEDAASDVDRQIFRSKANPPGPCVVVMPQDVLETESSEPSRHAGLDLDVGPGPGSPRPEYVAALAAALTSAQKGVLLAGDWVYREHCEDLVLEVAHKYRLSIVGEPRRSSSRRGRLSASALYVGEYENCRSLVSESDVLLSVGARTFVEFERANSSDDALPPTLIVIHPSADQIVSRSLGQLNIAASVESSLNCLLQTQKAHHDPKDQTELTEVDPPAAAPAQQALSETLTEGLTPANIGALLNSTLAPDAAVFDEAVTSSIGVMTNLKIHGERVYFRNTGGALGWGIPAAVGGKLAAPERQVVCLVGDGSALFGVHGLWTAADRRVDALFIVLNNKGYGSVRDSVNRVREKLTSGHEEVGVDLTPGVSFGATEVRFAPLAASLGVRSSMVSDLNELALRVNEWVAEGGPYLIDAHIGSLTGDRS